MADSTDMKKGLRVFFLIARGYCPMQKLNMKYLLSYLNPTTQIAILTLRYIR
jgi:hypothetical protein